MDRWYQQGCELRRFAPLPAKHPAIGEKCPACKQVFKESDVTTLIPVGPGDDKEERERCRERRPFIGLAVVVHWACATGDET